jgi:hypothetical protein
VWLVRNSPLGHQIESLTSGFSRVIHSSVRYVLVTDVGVRVPLGHDRPCARES